MTMMEYHARYEQDEPPTMRHVPPMDWVLRKLDDFRERVDKLGWAAFDAGRPVSAEQRDEIQSALRLVVRAVDNLASLARRGPAPRTAAMDDVRLALDHAFMAAISVIRSIDAVSFNRRSSEVDFHRAPGEPILAAVLVVLAHIRRVEQLVERVNPDLREMLLSKLVVSEHPVNEETLRPIA